MNIISKSDKWQIRLINCILVILLISLCLFSYGEADSLIDFAPNITNETLSSTDILEHFSSNENARAIVTATLFLDVCICGDEVVSTHPVDFLSNDSYLAISKDVTAKLG